MAASFEQIRDRYELVPIRNCPGRYVVHGAATTTPERLAGPGALARIYPGRAPDPVWVVALSDGGLISYEKGDGRFVHTLCDEAGFARKLAQLQIEPSARSD